MGWGDIILTLDLSTDEVCKECLYFHEILREKGCTCPHHVKVHKMYMIVCTCGRKDKDFGAYMNHVQNSNTMHIGKGKPRGAYGL